MTQEALQVMAALSVSCGLALAMFCIMVATFGTVVLPESWNWFERFGDRFMAASFGFMSGGMLLGMLIGFASLFVSG